MVFLMKKSLLLVPLLLCASCQPKRSAGTTTPETNEKQTDVGVPTPSSFIGMTLEEAEAKAEKADLPHRVISQDGKDVPVTRDYRPERLNFTIENGIVTAVKNG